MPTPLDQWSFVQCHPDTMLGWLLTNQQLFMNSQGYGTGQPLEVKAKWMKLILGQD